VVDVESDAEWKSNPRTKQFLRLLSGLRSSAGDVPIDAHWFDAVTTIVVDAVVDDDVATLRAGFDLIVSSDLREAFGPEAAGRLLQLRMFLRRAVDRLGPQEAVAFIDAGSHTAAMLRGIADRPGVSNADLMAVMGVDATEVARTGGRLRALGLAVAQRGGRRNAWDLTPRGRETLKLLKNSAPQAPELPMTPSEVQLPDRTIRKFGETATEFGKQLTAIIGQLDDQRRRQGAPGRQAELPAAWELEVKLAPNVRRRRGLVSVGGRFRFGPDIQTLEFKTFGPGNGELDLLVDVVPARKGRGATSG
jgi:hypothetical protein